MKRQKRVLAIHDISGVGKCSLTVALPIISAAGVECSVLPTAVLSTHTGGFTGFTYRDLTEDISPIVAHWQALHLKLDGIYTGFLGSFEQIRLVGDAFSALADKDTLLVVDPVMADGGKLYTIFDETFPPAMKKLCSKADVILPNMTEAAFMLGEDYVEGPYTHEYVESLLHRLAREIPVKYIVLTGVHFDGEELGAALYDAAADDVKYILGANIPGSYHGLCRRGGERQIHGGGRAHCCGLYGRMHRVDEGSGHGHPLRRQLRALPRRLQQETGTVRRWRVHRSRSAKAKGCKGKATVL